MRRFIKIAVLLLVCIIGIGALYIFAFGWPGDTSQVKINYGHSKLYSRKDREAAVKPILRKFKSFNNCRLEKISYISDEASKEELERLKKGDTWRYQEGYDKKNSAKSYDECIIFTSVFTTGSDPDPGLSAHDRYSNWHWILVRKKGGSWRLYSYGYG